MAVAGEASEDQLLKLTRLRLTLNEKLEILKQLDSEILDLLEEEADITTEIEQSDTFNQGIYEALVRIDKICEASSSTGPSGSTPGPGALEGGTERSAHRTNCLNSLYIISIRQGSGKWPVIDC